MLWEHVGKRAEEMRRLVFMLTAMALVLVLASGVALAVDRIGTNGPDTLRGTNGPITFSEGAATTLSLSTTGQRRGTSSRAVAASTGWLRTPKTRSRPTASRSGGALTPDRDSTNTSKRRGSTMTSSGAWRLSPEDDDRLQVSC